MNCSECKARFQSNHWNQKLCSDRCRRTRKNRTNLRLNHGSRGFAGYGERRCVNCRAAFKPGNSNQKSCSASCRLIVARARRNAAQKFYHHRDKARPEYVLKRVLRTCLTNLVSQKVLSSKTMRSHRFCSFTAPQFKRHIESQFKPGMRWENWGEWHIDHKRPLSSFRLTRRDGSEDLSQIIAANALSNLQPLWAAENLSKHAKWSGK